MKALLLSMLGTSLFISIFCIVPVIKNSIKYNDWDNSIVLGFIVFSFIIITCIFGIWFVIGVN